jgi:hypothetical protein
MSKQQQNLGRIARESTVQAIVGSAMLLCLAFAISMIVTAAGTVMNVRNALDLATCKTELRAAREALVEEE